MRLTVTGIGYLGLVHAVCMAHLGHQVTGMDADESRVAAAASGQPWFTEPGLDVLLQSVLSSGRLRFTGDPEQVAASGDVHFLCLPTPVKADGEADLSHLFGAAGALMPFLKGPAVIAGRSTVPPGTAAALAKIMRTADPAVEVAWNPEFLREGSAIADMLHPDRIIIGAGNDGAAQRLRSVYAGFTCPVTVTDLATAELCKLAANGFLAAKISFFNGIAQLACCHDADPEAISRSCAADPRIGEWGTPPGLGFGGGCLPKDVRMLRSAAQKAGLCSFPQMLGSVSEINRTQRMRAVSLASYMLGGLKGKTVAVLGLAFKPGTSDTRDSPGVAITDRLRAAGAHVTCHDPAIAGEKNAAGAIAGADLVIVATAWPEYADIDPHCFTPAKIIDARGCLDRRKWADAGWEYRGLDS